MSYNPVSYEVFVREFGQLVWDETSKRRRQRHHQGGGFCPQRCPAELGAGYVCHECQEDYDNTMIQLGRRHLYVNSLGREPRAKAGR